MQTRVELQLHFSMDTQGVLLKYLKSARWRRCRLDGASCIHYAQCMRMALHMNVGLSSLSACTCKGRR